MNRSEAAQIQNDQVHDDDDDMPELVHDDDEENENMAEPQEELEDEDNENPEANAEDEAQDVDEALAEAKAEGVSKLLVKAERPKASDVQQLAAEGAGTLSTRQDSKHEKFRITYEARQVVLNYCNTLRPAENELEEAEAGAKNKSEGKWQPQAPRGLVHSGLLVVPGCHARLSNITESGTWRETESFYVGSKKINHLAGRSVGATLIAYRLAREAQPDLFRKVSVMSQPAANVDSVIFCWAQQELSKEFPESYWQRDCFAGSFSAEGEKVQFLSHMFSTHILGKCTARLQLTDTDFSHKFKARVRVRMAEQRDQSEEALRRSGSSDAWQPSALDIVSSVVKAQDDMAEAQDHPDTEWILSGLRRNMMLSYRPYPEGLRPVTAETEKWAENMLEGSSRIPQSWYADRLNWRDSAGVPQEPNFELSKVAKEIADLIEWDYANPKPQDMAEDVDDEPILEVVKLAEELETDCSIAMQLQLPPQLRDALLRRADTEDWKGQAKLRAQKRKLKANATLVRKELSSGTKAALKDMLSEHSRATLMRTAVVPKSTVKGRFTAAAKEGALKHKGGAGKLAKHKGSVGKLANHIGGLGKVQLKSAKKAALKKLLAKAAKKLAAVEAQDAGAEETVAEEAATAGMVAAKAKAKAKAKPKADLQQDGPLVGQRLRVISEYLGRSKYGLEGLCKRHSKGTVCLEVGECTTLVEVAATQVEIASHKAPAFGHLGCISRLEKAVFLRNLRLWTQVTSDEEQVMWTPVTKEWISDQILYSCAQMLQWNYPCNEPGVKCYAILDPALSAQLALATEKNEVAQVIKLSECIVKASGGAHRILAPIFGGAISGGHWTLLCVDVSESGEISHIRYRDSLSGGSEFCKASAKLVLSALKHEAVLPERANHCMQPLGGACGWFVLSWIEKEICQLNGWGWACRGWPEENAKKLHLKTETFHGLLNKELARIKDESQQLQALHVKKLLDLQKKAEKAATQDSSRKELLALANTAKANLSGPSWINHISVADLPAAIQAKILEVEQSGFGVCSKCRWKSGR